MSADKVTVAFDAAKGPHKIVDRMGPPFPTRYVTRGRPFECSRAEADLWLAKYKGDLRKYGGAKAYEVRTKAGTNVAVTAAAAAVQALAEEQGVKVDPGLAGLLGTLLERAGAKPQITLTAEEQHIYERLVEEDPDCPPEVAQYIAKRQARVAAEARAAQGAMAKHDADKRVPADPPPEKRGKPEQPEAKDEKGESDESEPATAPKLPAGRPAAIRGSAPRPTRGTVTSDDVPKRQG